MAAILREKKILYLTLIGGGSCANPVDEIAYAMAKSHAKWSAHPAVKLERVILVLYSQQQETQSIVQRALQKEGISPNDIEIARYRNNQRSI